jgi:hypothetical protein
MSKTSVLIGALAAVAVHGLLFLPSLPSRAPDPAPAEASEPVTLTPPPPTPPAPKREDPPPPPTEPVEPERVEPMREVVKAPPAEEDTPGDTSARKPDDVPDDALPPLRIVWRSPGRLLEIARQYGLKIVAFDAAGGAVGEVGASGTLEAFDGRMEHFSNRVRRLPGHFFADHVRLPADAGVRGFWVLVPAPTDRRWIGLQREAIDRRGLSVAQVTEMEGAFRYDGGRYRLTVKPVVAR